MSVSLSEAVAKVRDGIALIQGAEVAQSGSVANKVWIGILDEDGRWRQFVVTVEVA